jgi:hypothetical protein
MTNRMKAISKIRKNIIKYILVLEIPAKKMLSSSDSIKAAQNKQIIPIIPRMTRRTRTSFFSAKGFMFILNFLGYRNKLPTIKNFDS